MTTAGRPGRPPTDRRAAGGTINSPTQHIPPQVALVGNHLPRRCGIATFTASLSDALSAPECGVESFVVAMNDLDRTYDYPPQVRAQVTEGDLASYRRAAAFINESGAQVVSLQHEFGIFGGVAGGHVLELMRALQPPIVTTLHTVLRSPTTSQRLVFEGVVERSARLVVMSHTGAELLQEFYDVPATRIDVIPHGTPSPSRHTEVKARLGFGARPVLLTFGLLSPDKGIEHVIDAMPEIVRRFPDALYVVLGATHPHVLLSQGERYRRALEARAGRLGVSSHVQLINRFATPEELDDLLAAADVYVTPYLNMEQITSGTLSYALGAGKPVISTPYSHARELLAEGRGVLVPPRDAAAIAHAAVALFASPARRGELAARALEASADAAWPLVAGRYREAFEEARRGHAAAPRPQRQKHASFHLATLPPTDLRHVARLTDSTGILQHAVRNVPRQRDGYCLDDNARALLLTTHIDEGDPAATTAHALAERYLAFVHHAFVPETGLFRNFMRYDRRWTEDRGSEDCHGRALWALGRVVRHSADLRNWGHHRLALLARKGSWWDANKVGLSPPLIETARGWLMIYHGVRHTAAGCLYRLGLALFDLERPDLCIARGDSWIFGPETDFERFGDVGNVTFPCGYTLDEDGDTLRLYYGAADTCVALATGSVREMLRWLDGNSSMVHP